MRTDTTTQNIKQLQEQAEKGNAEAQAELGWCYENGIGVEGNIQTAAVWYQKAAEQGDVDAQASLGRCFLNGLGVKQDSVQAALWLQKAATAVKVPAGQYAQGLCYAQGFGVSKDEKKAFQCFLEAAQQNCARAQNAVGTYYQEGKGTSWPSAAEAITWYSKAAKQNFVNAEYNIGNIYQNAADRCGVEKDVVEAAKWYRKAAERNFALAQYRLAGCYDNAEGVERSFTSALEWYEKAAANGHADATGKASYCKKKLQNLQRILDCIKEGSESVYLSEEMDPEYIGQLAAVLISNTTLRSLQFDTIESYMHLLAAAFVKNVGLQSLSFSYLGRRSESIKQLATMLEINCTLQSLTLKYSCDITSLGVQYLGEALTKNTSLRSLDFSDYSNVDAEGMRHLAKALETNRALQSLRLPYGKLTPLSMQYLKAALAKNTSLRSLELQNNKIDVEGIRHLADGLAKNTALQSLDVSSNGFSSAGSMRSLGPALAKNTSLQKLIFQHGQLDSEDMQHLATALKSNSTLQELDLRNSSIDPQGMQHLTAALENNKALRKLYISLGKNNTGSQSVQYLAVALEANNVLQELYLDFGPSQRSGQSIGPQGIQRLAAALEKNTSLLSIYCGDLYYEDRGPLETMFQKNMTLIYFSDRNTWHMEQSLKRNRQYRDHLIASVKEQHLAEVKRLLKLGVSPNVEVDGETLLMLAVKTGYAGLVEALLPRCRNISDLCKAKGAYEGKTAQQIAEMLGETHASIAEMLAAVSKKAMPTVTTAEEKTPDLKPASMSSTASTASSTATTTTASISTSTSTTTTTAPITPTTPAPIVSKQAEKEPNFSPILAYKELTLIKEIGKGGYGVVFQAIWRGKPAAVKQLINQHLSAKTKEEFLTEAQTMAGLHSSHIVQLFGYCESPYCLVMEYMPKGSLYHVLHGKERLEWPERMQIISDLAEGVAYLHQKKILHRDIKSLNVLLNDQGRAKLTDFGLVQVKRESLMSTKGAVGTVAWMPPESFQRRATYTEASDIYAFAVTCWEIAARKTPFEDATNPAIIPTWVQAGEREEIPKDCPSKLATLIEACWAGEAATRPSADTVVRYLKSAYENFGLFAKQQTPTSAANADTKLIIATLGQVANVVKEGNRHILGAVLATQEITEQTADNVQALQSLEKAKHEAEVAQLRFS
jgi:TPR repeat protein/Ran GTPase-activating protein (RanGAP) involved in mRNA processing and transport/predicted Ser/Thr protein kinase